MPPFVRELSAIAAALVTGGAAVHVLTEDSTANWVDGATKYGSNWATNPQSGLVLGAIAAVAVCVVVASRGSRRSGWAAVATFGALIVGATLLPRWVDGTGLLQVLQIVRALAAGAMLGSAVAAAWGRLAWQAGLTAGVLTAALSAAFRNTPWLQFTTVDDAHAVQLAHHEPNWWLLGTALVVAIAAAATTQSEFRLQRPNQRAAAFALGGILAFAVIDRLLGEWVSSAAIGDRPLLWRAVFVSVAILLAVALVLATVAQPSNGRFALVALAVAAAVAILVRDMRWEPLSIGTTWLILAALLATIVGTRASGVRPNALIGLGVVAIVPLLSTLWPDFGTDCIGLLLRIVLVGLGAGYALGSTYSSESPFAAVGLAILSASSTLVAAASTPVSGRINFAYVEHATEGAVASLDGPNVNEFRLAGLAMLVVVVVCTAGVAEMRRVSGTAKPVGFGPAR